MSKAVMASIQPYYVFLIIAKYMGWNIPQDKKVEVRKGFPKDKCWNKKVHIYCSKNKKSFNRIPKEYQPLMRPFLGKVIGEFVCDNINKIEIRHFTIFGHENRYCAIGDNADNSWLQHSCLNYNDVVKYGKLQPLYGWQISDLKIYDKPKELSEFFSTAYQKNCGCCVCLCEYYPNCALKKNRKPLTRPPQSWCYVEELEE